MNTTAYNPEIAVILSYFEYLYETYTIISESDIYNLYHNKLQ